MAYHPGKPFRLPPRRKHRIDAADRAKDRAVNTAVSLMAGTLKRATQDIVTHYLLTGHFVEPNLSVMDTVTEKFYRMIITEAWNTTEADKRELSEAKKLAVGKPPKPPKKAKSLDDIFRDSRYWRAVMRRSQAMTKRMKTYYLKKLRKKFDEVIPAMTAGEFSPVQAMDKMADVWKTSRSRVEVIFRTETTNYFARSQVAFFEDEDEIIGFLFDSIRDTARTDICKSRHGLVYKPGTKKLRENTPALHYNCRSHLIPLANTAANRKMVSDPSRDPEKRNVAPLPRNWVKS